VIKREVELIME